MTIHLNHENGQPRVRTCFRLTSLPPGAPCSNSRARTAHSDVLVCNYGSSKKREESQEKSRNYYGSTDASYE